MKRSRPPTGGPRSRQRPRTAAGGNITKDIDHPVVRDTDGAGTGEEFDSPMRVIFFWRRAKVSRHSSAARGGGWVVTAESGCKDVMVITFLVMVLMTEVMSVVTVM